MAKQTMLSYKDRVFKNALIECFSNIYQRVLGESINDLKSPESAEAYIEEAKRVYEEEANLNNEAAHVIKTRMLDPRNYYTRLVIETAEEIAEERMEGVTPKTVADANPELTEEEKEVIDTAFNDNVDEEHVGEVRDAVASAVQAEKEKAEAIKDAVEMDKENTPDGSLSESTQKLIKRRPNSLLEAIYKHSAEEVIREGLEKKIPTEKILSENKTIIQDVSVKVYTIYETMHKFGFRVFSDEDIDRRISKYTK